MYRSLPVRTAAVLVAVVLAASGCSGSDDDDGDAAPVTTAAPVDGPTTTADDVEGEPLDILVTNDDGYDSRGIDELVEALLAVDGVSVTVVAPLEGQSSTGRRTTEGEVATSEVVLASGHPATAVDGYPSDAVRVALEELGLEPDLVVAGINRGQNLGPITDFSGTVGAAREAVARGVPAVAASQGTDAEESVATTQGEAGPDTLDYGAAASLVVDWVRDRKAALVAGEVEPAVVNVNVPTCTSGMMRGVVETEVDFDADPVLALSEQECTSTDPARTFDSDVEAFLVGYATITPLPDEARAR